MVDIQKTTYSVTVLHRRDEAPPPGATMEHVLEMISDGPWIGAFESGGTVDVPAKDVQGELLKIGNDGSFFDDEC